MSHLHERLYVVDDKIENPKTKREISINGDAFKKLVRDKVILVKIVEGQTQYYSGLAPRRHVASKAARKSAVKSERDEESD